VSGRKKSFSKQRKDTQASFVTEGTSSQANWEDIPVQQDEPSVKTGASAATAETTTTPVQPSASPPTTGAKPKKNSFLGSFTSLLTGGKPKAKSPKAAEAATGTGGASPSSGPPAGAQTTRGNAKSSKSPHRSPSSASSFSHARSSKHHPPPPESTIMDEDVSMFESKYSYSYQQSYSGTEGESIVYADDIPEFADADVEKYFSMLGVMDHIEKFIAFGVVSAKDVCDVEIVSLATDADMTHEQVAKLHQSTRALAKLIKLGYQPQRVLDAYLFCLGDEKKTAKLLKNVDGEDDASAVHESRQLSESDGEGSEGSSVYSSPILQRSTSANSSSYDTSPNHRSPKGSDHHHKHHKHQKKRRNSPASSGPGSKSKGKPKKPIIFDAFDFFESEYVRCSQVLVKLVIDISTNSYSKDKLKPKVRRTKDLMLECRGFVMMMQYQMDDEEQGSDEYYRMFERLTLVKHDLTNLDEDRKRMARKALLHMKMLETGDVERKLPSEVEIQTQWFEGYDHKEKRLYYFNAETGTSQWEKPDAPYLSYEPEDNTTVGGDEESLDGWSSSDEVFIQQQISSSIQKSKQQQFSRSRTVDEFDEELEGTRSRAAEEDLAEEFGDEADSDEDELSAAGPRDRADIGVGQGNVFLEELGSFQKTLQTAKVHKDQQSTLDRVLAPQVPLPSNLDAVLSRKGGGLDELEATSPRSGASTFV